MCLFACQLRMQVRCLSWWAGADVEIGANGGSSCVGVAAANGYLELLKLLVQAGANVQRPGLEVP